MELLSSCPDERVMRIERDKFKSWLKAEDKGRSV